MNIMGFDWEKGNWPKCGKHGVSKSEIEAVFNNRPAVHPDITHSHTEERYKAIGVNMQGRHIYLVFVLRHTDQGILIRPVSARYMHQKEIEHYEQS